MSFYLFFNNVVSIVVLLCFKIYFKVSHKTTTLLHPLSPTLCPESTLFVSDLFWYQHGKNSERVSEIIGCDETPGSSLHVPYLKKRI